jgi:hypothetical protein
MLFLFHRLLLYKALKLLGVNDEEGLEDYSSDFGNCRGPIGDHIRTDLRGRRR